MAKFVDSHIFGTLYVIFGGVFLHVTLNGAPPLLTQEKKKKEKREREEESW